MLPIFLHNGGIGAFYFFLKTEVGVLEIKRTWDYLISLNCHSSAIFQIEEPKLKRWNYFSKDENLICIETKLDMGMPSLIHSPYTTHVPHMGNYSSSKPHSNRVKGEKSMFHGGRHIKAKVKTWVLCSSSDLASYYILHLDSLPLLL